MHDCSCKFALFIFSFFFLSYSSSRTHSEGVCEAPVKLPLSPVRQVEDLFEIFSEALQRGQTAAVLQHDRRLTTVLCWFFVVFFSL